MHRRGTAALTLRVVSLDTETTSDLRVFVGDDLVVEPLAVDCQYKLNSTNVSSPVYDEADPANPVQIGVSWGVRTEILSKVCQVKMVVPPQAKVGLIPSRLVRFKMSGRRYISHYVHFRSATSLTYCQNR